MKQSCSLPKL